MRFTCEQKTLAKALSTVGRGIEKNTVLPVARGVKIVAEKKTKHIKLTSTSHTLSIECTIDGHVEEDGVTVVPGAKFIDIVKALPSGEVMISFNGTHAFVETETSKFSLATFNPTEFPMVEEDNVSMPVSIDKDAFVEMIRGVSFSASDDETKGFLTGIKVELANGTMTMVALDGFRMAVRRESVLCMDKIEFLVAAKTMNEMARVVSDASEVRVALGEKNSSFTIGNTKFYTRTMEHKNYIEWEKLISDETKTTIKAPLKELFDSVNRASLFSSGANSLIRFSVTKDNVEITSRGEDGGADEDVAVEVQGNDIEIGFNAKYMTAALGAITDEEINIALNTNVAPAIITPVSGDGFLYLVLPVRLP